MTKTASFPELYEQHLVEPLFRPWAELTLDALRITTGDHLLDVACGTGIVARLARERVGDGGRVVGVDVNRGMIAVARRLTPGVEWREGDGGLLGSLLRYKLGGLVLAWALANVVISVMGGVAAVWLGWKVVELWK